MKKRLLALFLALVLAVSVLGVTALAAIRYTVTFVDGDKRTTVYVEAGKQIDSFSQPTKEGYIFNGWFRDPQCTQRYYREDKVTGNLTLYAGWKDLSSHQIIMTIGNPVMQVFGETVVNDVAPIIRNNRTMLPVRFVAETLGGTVTWNEKEQRVSIIRGTLRIVFEVGSTTAYTDDQMDEVDLQPTEIDCPVIIENNRTYAPVRFLCEAMGAKVDWDEATQTVTVTKPGDMWASDQREFWKALPSA